ncbi:hypothetical protein M0R19_05890 [Candidatus Pacearchaeota archaeon]|nr:hypothetical protein [Candidatus Pacearchaeota archaeon]
MENKKDNIVSISEKSKKKKKYKINISWIEDKIPFEVESTEGIELLDFNCPFIMIKESEKIIHYINPFEVSHAVEEEVEND